jgi:predicted HD superfamily hydrolase involved in NAD metabolism
VSRSSELLGPARELLASRLSSESFEHSGRVAAAAVTLAVRFGADADDAELAGLLHDYARDEPSGSLLRLADELGVPTIPFEREHPYVMHAPVGAAMVRRDVPGVEEAVLSAIAVHTVGAARMSDLDRIVYLADMIEDGRAYPGVDEVRAACEGGSLAECFRVAYGRSILHVMEKHDPMHPLSVDVCAAIEREAGRAVFDAPVTVR